MFWYTKERTQKERYERRKNKSKNTKKYSKNDVIETESKTDEGKIAKSIIFVSFVGEMYNKYYWENGEDSLKESDIYLTFQEYYADRCHNTGCNSSEYSSGKKVEMSESVFSQIEEITSIIYGYLLRSIWLYIFDKEKRSEVEEWEYSEEYNIAIKLEYMCESKYQSNQKRRKNGNNILACWYRRWVKISIIIGYIL